jgi:hypothetical protein
VYLSLTFFYKLGYYEELQAYVIQPKTFKQVHGFQPAVRIVSHYSYSLLSSQETTLKWYYSNFQYITYHKLLLLGTSAVQCDSQVPNF